MALIVATGCLCCQDEQFGDSAGDLQGTGGAPGTGGVTATGGTTSGIHPTGGSPSQGTGGSTSDSSGGVGTGGSGGEDENTGGTTADTDGTDPCNAPDLTWKTARKTHYTSYPDPGSEECVEYNGCMWAGYFAGCNGQQPEDWVASVNIAAFFPDYEDYEHHDLCIRSGDETMIVTVYDTCADSDCSGCCTANQGDNDALIDLESHTNERWGLSYGVIEWADLGPTENVECQ